VEAATDRIGTAGKHCPVCYHRYREPTTSALVLFCITPFTSIILFFVLFCIIPFIILSFVLIPILFFIVFVFLIFIVLFIVVIGGVCRRRWGGYKESTPFRPFRTSTKHDATRRGTGWKGDDGSVGGSVGGSTAGAWCVIFAVIVIVIVVIFVIVVVVVNVVVVIRVGGSRRKSRRKGRGGRG
jgi:hypothetical protein